MKEDQNTNELRQIRRALLQAAKEDYLEALKDAPEAPPFSKNHRRWERRFLKDPFSLITPHRPLWQRGLQTVACVLILISTVFGSVLMTNSTARATVEGWFVRNYSTHDSYEFRRRGETGVMLPWRVTKLPDGYQQTECINLVSMTNVIYSNGDSEQDIELSYQKMYEGGGENLDNEWHTVSVVKVHDMEGRFYLATETGPNMLVWFDEKNVYAFLLIARQPEEVMIEMAESVEVAED